MSHNDLPSNSLVCLISPIFYDGFAQATIKRVAYGPNSFRTIARVNNACAFDLSVIPHTLQQNDITVSCEEYTITLHV